MERGCEREEYILPVSQERRRLVEVFVTTIWKVAPELWTERISCKRCQRYFSRFQRFPNVIREAVCIVPYRVQKVTAGQIFVSDLTKVKLSDRSISWKIESRALPVEFF